jgi:DedD protein
MRGYFDEDEPRAERPRRDTELTLGAGSLLGIFFALALLCGLCFAVGYGVGHRSSPSSVASTLPTASPDQEPLQSNNSIPKPSAAEGSPIPAPQSGDSSTTPAAGTGTNPTSTQQKPAGSGQTNGQSGQAPRATGGITSAQVRPALPGGGGTAPASQGGPAPNVHTALPAQVQFMVQIAAVMNAEDADVLESALRKRGYSVTAMREPADGLIHVRIGPFWTRDEANGWRDKLLGDGYNAAVQP